jgi:DNA protecting protein DprA
MRQRGSGQPICGSMRLRSSEVLGVGPTGPTGLTALDETGRVAWTGAESSFERAVSERDAWAVLAGVRGLGPVAFGLLLGRYRTATAILAEGGSVGGTARLLQALEDADGGQPRGQRVAEQIVEGITAATETADATLARIRELGLTIVTLDDAAFPSRLAAIEMPPHVLYVLGDPAALDRPAAVAIVGTRRATDHGRAVAARIATNLALVGASVVSGLAVGIDGAAHAAAVNAKGITVAVIGSGHATITPSAHRRLAHAILAGGGAIVSELGPDVVPSKGTFPRRNRIISGLLGAGTGARLLPRPWTDRRARLRGLSCVPPRIPGHDADRRRYPAAHRRPRARGPSRHAGRADASGVQPRGRRRGGGPARS